MSTKTAAGLVAEAIRLRERDARRALQLCEQALAVDGAQDDEISRALTEKAVCHLMLSEYPTAERVAREALAACARPGSDGHEPAALMALGNACFRQGRLDEARDCFRRAMSCIERADRPDVRMTACNNLGNVGCAMGLYAEALGWYEACLALARDAGNRERELTVLCNIADLHAEVGDRTRAIELVEHVLAHDGGENRYRRSLLLLNLAGLFLAAGDAEGARRHFSTSLELAQAHGNRLVEVEAQRGLAEAAEALGLHDEVSERYRRARELQRAVGDAPGEVLTLRSLAREARRRGDLREALGLLAECVKLAGSIGELRQRLDARCDEAEVLLAAGETVAAREALEDALAVAQTMGVREPQREAHRMLSVLAERLGDAAAALTHYRQAHALERELRGEAVARRLEQLKARSEIATARREAEQQRMQRDELARSNEELERLGEEMRKAKETAEAMLEEANRLATQDPLTGLSNRRRFEERLAEEWDRARAGGRPLAVAVLDLDHFKRINDRFGHATGDVVLRRVGDILASEAGSRDVPARLGGEEFVLLMPGRAQAEARATCERIRERLAETTWSDVAPGLSVTISAGVADAAASETGPDMLVVADVRLYEAKHGGRDRIVG